MGELAAIATAIAALAGLALWWLKRRSEPTAEQKQQDYRDEIERLLVEIGEARERGDDARADALRRRLYQLTGAKPIGASDAAGQCGPGDAAGGNDDLAAKL